MAGIGKLCMWKGMKMKEYWFCVPFYHYFYHYFLSCTIFPYQPCYESFILLLRLVALILLWVWLIYLALPCYKSFKFCWNIREKLQCLYTPVLIWQFNCIMLNSLMLNFNWFCRDSHYTSLCIHFTSFCSHYASCATTTFPRAATTPPLASTLASSKEQ